MDPDDIEGAKDAQSDTHCHLLLLNCKHMIAILKTSFEDFEKGELPKTVLFSFWRAIFGFFANLCSFGKITHVPNPSPLSLACTQL